MQKRGLVWGAMMLLLTACGGGQPTKPPEGSQPPTVVGGTCRSGDISCDAMQELRCEDGAWVASTACENACAPSLGCVECVPFTGTCSNGAETICRSDGSGFETHACDADLGLTCGANGCEGACSYSSLGDSYVGCEFYPTVTANGLKGEWDFAVVLANTGLAPAHVRIDGGALSAEKLVTIQPGAVNVVRLPFHQTLQFCDGVLGQSHWCSIPEPYGAMVSNGAYRVRSDQPLSAYQFNPLDYIKGNNTYSHTNDASLVLPKNVLGTRYVVSSWPTWQSPERDIYPGIAAIVGTEENTVVKVTPPAGITAHPLGVGGTTHTVTLHRGDVLELAAGYHFENLSNIDSLVGEDLTGTIVDATKPVMVLGGHYCTFIPSDVGYCDHLEDILLPISALSNRYVVTAPIGIEKPARVVVRIVATESNTTLVYSSKPSGAASSIAKQGGVIEFVTDKDFELVADKKVAVTTFMMGEDVTGTGDPAMAQQIPQGQWRTDYTFHAPVNYEKNYVNIVMPTGTTVTLDNQEVTNVTVIPNSEYQVARVELTDGTNGDHQLSANNAVGISVYGYGRFTSYWYPGGSNIKPILVD